MEKISAVIITKNEEKNIAGCLKSLQGIADEIIVVDSFSTDRTKEICLEYGARFEVRTFTDYSDQKNFGNNLAQFPFIFSIDADEHVSEELKTSILEIKKSDGKSVYQVNRLTNYCGHWIRHSGWYPDAKLRLWRKGDAEWKGNVHETLVVAEGVQTKALHGDLLHYSFPNIATHVDRLNRYTDMMAQQMLDQGKKANIFKIIFSPIFDFLKKYFLQGGILDGYYGFVICIMSAYYRFLKYIKLRRLYEK